MEEQKDALLPYPRSVASSFVKEATETQRGYLFLQAHPASWQQEGESPYWVIKLMINATVFELSYSVTRYLLMTYDVSTTVLGSEEDTTDV